MYRLDIVNFVCYFLCYILSIFISHVTCISNLFSKDINVCSFCLLKYTVQVRLINDNYYEV